jgi:hypothetical protein
VAFQAWTYSDDDSMMVARWEQTTEHGTWLRKGFGEPPRNVSSIRIRSEYSPSWISFIEVVVIGKPGSKKSVEI